MTYGLETVPLTKSREAELKVAELKMLRFLVGVTRVDKILNEYIPGAAYAGRIKDRLFGHVMRRGNLSLKDDGNEPIK